MPYAETKGVERLVYVFASFDQSIFIELAITALEEKGFQKNAILAVPFEQRTRERLLFDTIHRADGISLLDVAAVLGTCGMLLGAIYGFVLAWGPILWGIIGLGSGLIIGVLLKLAVVKKNSGEQTSRTMEVLLMVRCDPSQVELVEKILWDHTALGIAALER